MFAFLTLLQLAPPAAAKAKLVSLAVTNVLLVVAQSDPISQVTGSGEIGGVSVGGILDTGVTLAALGLLYLIIRMILAGDLVTKKTIEAVTSQVVRETLRHTEGK